MNPTKNIIFDFDGTLADTAPLIIATMLATIRELGLPDRTEAECRATIGLRLEEVPAALWPLIPGMGVRYEAAYQRIFAGLKRQVPVVCFPGVADTMSRLHDRGYAMAIASSRNRESLRELAGMFGIDHYLAMLVGGDDVTEGKPSPEPVLTILNAQGWSARETLVVGDAAVDIMMGRAAHCRTCGVTYGNGTVGDLENAGADVIIGSFDRIVDCV